MSLETWWSAVRPDTRDWLVAHNGEPLPMHVVEDITRVDGPVDPEASWVDVDEDGVLRLTDAAVDWVEAVANGETPPAP
ncbi:MULTISPECIES: hypothetical protein [unclassified Terrabacter]|uniref:hypothetical protein n=1 Tax=unclassified Terrabacter TaxID=2630222 RepID=UPI0006FB49CA|nr:MULTISPECIES: hypothetical protein [unclassified Terrabacter]KRB45037.1 hypothetical protein ASD90_15190 [Terrabacter sp. Root181]KRF41012.1 hypothetical protein ASG96_09495 [Terrabacter sp. Soil810]